MTNDKLIQFVKEEILKGRGFSEIQTEIQLKNNLNFSDVNSIFDTAKEELGIPLDEDEGYFKKVKRIKIGNTINIISWTLLIISILTIFFTSKDSKIGSNLFIFALFLSGISIVLTEYVSVKFITFSGVGAKIFGWILIISTFSGLLDSCTN